MKEHFINKIHYAQNFQGMGVFLLKFDETHITKKIICFLDGGFIASRLMLLLFLT